LTERHLTPLPKGISPFEKGSAKGLDLESEFSKVRRVGHSNEPEGDGKPKVWKSNSPHCSSRGRLNLMTLTMFKNWI
jgi:hypothetical protein